MYQRKFLFLKKYETIHISQISSFFHIKQERSERQIQVMIQGQGNQSKNIINHKTYEITILNNLV